jgi:para-aminobenzoate synthetase component I
VTVPELQVVESFAFTHQMISTIRGRLCAHHTPLGLIAASFPGGSMTGAPKVAAMKLIDRLEPVKRGVFSGSIGYFDFEGMIGLNIVIRTFIKKKAGALAFHVGGAIVSDSDAAEEHQEILDKAAGLVAALEHHAQGGGP